MEETLELEARFRLLAATRTRREAAEELGWYRSRVQTWEKRLGVKFRTAKGGRRRSAKPVGRAPAGRPSLELVAQETAAAKRRNPSVTAIEYCRECHAPVSNWGQHFDRTGHRRPLSA